MVRFKKNTAENFSVTGLEINPTTTPIPLVKGWNDLAYLLRSDAPLDAAVNASSIPAGNVLLKGLEGSAVYYPGTGWTGELDSMKLLHGYKLNVQNAGNLYYDASGASKKSSPVTSRKSSPETVVSHRELLRLRGYEKTKIISLKEYLGE